MRPGRRGQALFASFSAAVFLAVYLLPSELWPWLGLFLLAPAGLFLWRGQDMGTLLCLGAAAALLWCGAYRAVFFAPAQDLDGERTTVKLYLSESPTPTDYGACAAGWAVQAGKAPVQSVLYGDDELLELGPGDRVTVLADCSQTALREDARFTARATRGVFLRLIAKGPMEVERAGGVTWWCLPRLWSERLGQSIQAALPDDVSGFLRAMVTGDRTGIDSALNTDLRRAGVAHLVAVSGMHVCFLVGLLTRLTGYDPRRRALVCIPALLFFALAVGGSPSVLRACCLQLAVLLAELLGRETEAWTSLFGTLAFLLLLDPFGAANVSLQLSFAAVAGITLITPRVCAALARFRLAGEEGWVWRVNGVLRFFQNLLATTLGALAFTVPLCAWYFGTVSVAAPLTNLLILPVASVLFVGTLTVGLVGLALPGPAALLGGALVWPGRYVRWVAQRVSAFPYSCLPVSGIYGPAVLLAGGALAAMLLCWLGRRRRWWVLGVCAMVVMALGVTLTTWGFRAVTLTAAVLDVGQGQSVVLSSKGKTALIDCGGSGYDDPGDVCADYLYAHGVTRVDALILTHYHADHANGVGALFRRLDIGQVILPAMERDEDAQLEILALARQEGAKVTWLEEDRAYTLGGMGLQLYAPLGAGGANEEGLSALVTAGEFHLLITGDMNEVVEERLVQKADLPLCQALVVGHHGSRYASGDVLLDAIAPQTAVISVGANNRYGHPAPETLERLEARNITVRRTDHSGTVTLRVP